MIHAYTSTFGSTWRPVTKRKHADDFARFVGWLEEHELPVTTDSLSFFTLVEYVGWLRSRPKITGVWRGGPEARAQSLLRSPTQTLSSNSVNAYMRPLRSLVIWLIEEGLLDSNPFARSRRRSALNPLLPSEDTPTKSATLADLQLLEAGCGDGPRIRLLQEFCYAGRMRSAAKRRAGSRGSVGSAITSRTQSPKMWPCSGSPLRYLRSKRDSMGSRLRCHSPCPAAECPIRRSA